MTLPYLNAFINETLRLFPTTPTGGLRESPPEGLRVAGRWIPPNITIVAPAYCIGRRELRLISIAALGMEQLVLTASCTDPDYFSQPDEFIPERWVDEESFHMVKNRRAFMPFKQGRSPHSCLLLTIISVVQVHA